MQMVKKNTRKTQYWQNYGVVVSLLGFSRQNTVQRG